MNDVIHILYRTSDLFAEQTCASIASILYNTGRACRFYILESNMSEGEKRKMASLEARFPELDMTFVQFDREKFAGDVDVDSFPLGGYHRLYAPWMFPELDRLITMDSDTVIDGDIADMWDADMGGYCIAGCPNPADYTKYLPVEHEELIGMKKGALHLNGGVIYMNLRNIRHAFKLKVLFDRVDSLRNAVRQSGFLWFFEEDALTSLFRETTLELPPRMNTIAGYYEMIMDTKHASLNAWADAYRTPLVIHYAGGALKPAFISDTNMHMRFVERYFFYKALTPYADVWEDALRVRRYNELEITSKHMYGTGLKPQSSHEYVMGRHVPILRGFAGLMGQIPFKQPKIAAWGNGVYLQTLLLELKVLNIDVDVVVDGLPEKQGERVFHYRVESPGVLEGKSDEYGVILATTRVHPSVVETLRRYGYGGDDVRHAFCTEVPGLFDHGAHITQDDWRALLK